MTGYWIRSTVFVVRSGTAGTNPADPHISSPQQQSLDETFLKDAVMERLKDDVPQVVAAALRILEVSDVTDGYLWRLKGRSADDELLALCSVPGGVGCFGPRGHRVLFTVPAAQSGSVHG